MSLSGFSDGRTRSWAADAIESSLFGSFRFVWIGIVVAEKCLHKKNIRKTRTKIFGKKKLPKRNENEWVPCSDQTHSGLKWWFSPFKKETLSFTIGYESANLKRLLWSTRLVLERLDKYCTLVKAERTLSAFTKGIQIQIYDDISRVLPVWELETKC